MKKLLTLTSLCLAAASLQAQTASGPLSPAPARAQLVEAQQELSRLRDQITAAKIPLAVALREAETELLAKRREAERLQRLADNRSVDLRNLETEEKMRADEIDYISTLLTDYTSRLNSTIDSSEIQIYGRQLTHLLNLAENPDLPREEVLRSKVAVLDLGFERLLARLGGARFDGRAILPDGSVEPGTFALLGPLSYFRTADGKQAGLVERGAAEHPKITVFSRTEIPAIAGFIAAGDGPLPVDPTLGKAKAIVTSKESLGEHIQKGGLWMFPILGFGAAAVVMALFKLWELSSVKRLPKTVLREVLALLGQGKASEAAKTLRTHTSPASRMLNEAIHNLKLPKEVLDEMMFETMLEVQPRLERGLSFISVTAAVAPLLGLLGTVTGMMTTFNLITLFGTGDAKSLSSGISEALITTEFGLIVAIPSLLLYGYLSRRVNGVMGDMEQISTAFSNGVAAIRSRQPDLDLSLAGSPEPVAA
ncbi:MAG: MotA/TolQ/ExbB proton channel family protein [Verrucomicrobiae bacterium]|nr:MotA/TolQ/ExbB proton channel family protein [Verrucomicrobiae bacterium]